MSIKSNDTFNLLYNTCAHNMWSIIVTRMEELYLNNFSLTLYLGEFVSRAKIISVICVSF